MPCLMPCRMHAARSPDRPKNACGEESFCGATKGVCTARCTCAGDAAHGTAMGTAPEAPRRKRQGRQGTAHGRPAGDVRRIVLPLL